MLRMYMSEKMQPGLDCCYAAEKFFRTVMDITVKPVNGGTAKTVIVVAANEYLLRTRKVAEPVHEIQRFLLAAVHGKVARMHNDVSLWQIVQSSVTAMRV